MEKLNVMLDIETLGTGVNCVVLSVAAIQFDNKGKLYNKYNVSLNIDQQQRLGRNVDSSTIEWWLKQKPEIFRAQLQNPIELGVALTELAKITKGHYIWSNGASFDIPIVASLYRQLGIDIPWNFWDERCARTIMACLAVKGEKPKNAHDPMADCLYQIKEVLRSRLVK